MKNPLHKYEKHLDAIEFLKNNFTCYADKIVVPYASDCYFCAPLFSKFNFHLNFVDDGAYYFWDIFKEDRMLMLEVMKNFEDLPFEEERETFEKIMLKEDRPLYRAVLFMFLTNSHPTESFIESLSLGLDRVAVDKGTSFDKSDFAFQSCVDNFSIGDDETINYLNSFKSKILIANNPSAAIYIDHDHKIDFEDCFLLVSTRGT